MIIDSLTRSVPTPIAFGSRIVQFTCQGTPLKDEGETFMAQDWLIRTYPKAGFTPSMLSPTSQPKFPGQCMLTTPAEDDFIYNYGHQYVDANRLTLETHARQFDTITIDVDADGKPLNANFAGLNLQEYPPATQAAGKKTTTPRPPVSGMTLQLLPPGSDPPTELE